MQTNIEAVILDWAGTLVDFGSRAPLSAFMQVFSQAGIDVTEEETRLPMGTEKKLHIRQMLELSRIQQAWQQRYQRPSEEDDVERLYQALIPLQMQAIADHTTLIDGVTAMTEALRERSIVIGTTTGYSREMIDGMLERAKDQGFTADCVVASDEVANARPGPGGALKAAVLLGVNSVRRCIKVDDTIPGIAEGVNAGMWTVAVALSGNALGLSQEQWQTMTDADRQECREQAYRALESSGAHYVIDSVADLLPVICDINLRLSRREKP